MRERQHAEEGEDAGEGEGAAEVEHPVDTDVRREPAAGEGREHGPRPPDDRTDAETRSDTLALALVGEQRHTRGLADRVRDTEEAVQRHEGQERRRERAQERIGRRETERRPDSGSERDDDGDGPANKNNDS